MATRKAKRSPDWWERDAARNERVRLARLKRDRQKSAGRNLEEGSELVRFAHEFAAAFEEARSRE